jgi:hypothetical protein
MDHIRLVVAQQPVSGQYALTAYFGTFSNGTAYEKVQHSYPVDQTLGQTLAKLSASLEVYFSLSGPYLTSQGEDEFFYFTDPYFHHFNSINSQIAQSLTSQLAGKSFSWLGISLLDENAVRIQGDGLMETIYFGTGGTVTTQTVTSVSTESFTSTMLSTLTSTMTITQSPQTTTVTTTTTTAAFHPSSNAVKPDYSANAISGVVLGIAIALIGSIATVAISRKR